MSQKKIIVPPTNLIVIVSSGTVNLNCTGGDGATYTVHQAEQIFGVVADYEALVVDYSSYNVTATSIAITELKNGPIIVNK